jgi:predicted branched-subunit amino acid permease
LDFAIAATFIALVVPQIKTLPILVCVAVAAMSSIIFSLYQSPIGLIGAASLGMLAGFAVQRWRAAI